MYKNKITIKELEEKIFNAKPCGNGAVIYIPKKYIGRRIRIKIMRKKE